MKTYKSMLPELTIKYKNSDINKVKITCSGDAYEVFKKVFDGDTIDYFESFFCIFLNRANNTIGYFKVSSGGVSGTVVDPKLIFSTALKAGASSIIMAHNHPSQNLNPSQADKNMTQKCKEAGRVLEIPVLDHIIITSEKGYYSFGDEGIL